MAEIPDAPPSIGPVAGKYELVRLIGRGGMGTVWEGRHVSLGTRVAIKFIDVEYADSQEARTRFDNEARAAATIQSKHAIQIFDHGVTDDGKPYIVMELLVGEPLDARLDRLGRISLGDTARILRQVGRALARAHERGIVHRDLKPENIFLVRTPDEDDEIAEVLDFGIAKFKKIDGQSGSGSPLPPRRARCSGRRSTWRPSKHAGCAISITASISGRWGSSRSSASAAFCPSKEYPSAISS